MEYTIGMQVFGDWYITKKIGEGASGCVYELQKDKHGNADAPELKSAMKVIRIPNSENEIKTVSFNGMDEFSVRAYYKDRVDAIVKEIELLAELKGHQNIVSCEDYLVKERKDAFGWDVLIRMELLTSLTDYVIWHGRMTEGEVMRIGRDLCSALVSCHRKNIIHRDIKPQNIFVNKYGNFKLGDFGVARIVGESMGASTKTGTPPYMAPEVYFGRHYDARADICSLGLVLYKLMNNGRLPFYPTGNNISYSDIENAIQHRMSGETIPPPADASEAFAKVILKACSYDARDRYQTAQEMLDAFRFQPKPVAPKPRLKPYLIVVPLLMAILLILVAANVIRNKYSTDDGGAGGDGDSDAQSEYQVTVYLETYRDGQQEAPESSKAYTGTYKTGENVSLEAMKDEGDPDFSHWELLAGNVEIGDTKEQEINFVMPEENVELRAVFGTDDLSVQHVYQFEDYGIGDVLSFGSYEQDDNSANGKEPIEWIVLDKANDKLLVLSKYGIDVQQYNNDWEYGTWENCSLRAWLNTEFINNAFGTDERNYLVSALNENPDNPIYFTSGGNDTNDYAFLLTYDEMERYYPEAAERTIVNTKYAESRINAVNGEDIGIYWLRTGGSSDCEDAMVISKDGSIDYDGKCVDKYEVVRPAIWINATV